MMDLTVNYNEQMLNRYPEIIKSIREFQALIKSQSIEVENLHNQLNRILENAYISTANEDRISEWERFLGIIPSEKGKSTKSEWLEDRRATILARLYQTPKLNTKAISDIVGIFTGGTAESYFKDGTLYVFIDPPENNKSYNFESVKQELQHKIPAHLAFEVNRKYQDWESVNTDNLSWKEVVIGYDTWNDLLLSRESKTNKLDVTTFEKFHLA